MSILEIGFLTGFKPINATIGRLLKEKFADGIIDQYEITQQNVIFYLTRIGAEGVTVAFDMIQEIEVKQPQPAKINVYDYYEPSIRCGIFYSLPKNFPNIRTSNCEEGGDDSFCKCAEGVCLKCRTRRQQYEETTCLQNATNCQICERGEGQCFNPFVEACKRNYMYVVNVTKTFNESIGDVFVGFEANIWNETKPGSALVEKNTKVTFTLRTDCHKKCKDPHLEKIARSNNKNEEYIKVGGLLTIIGGAPEKLDRGGVTEHTFFLDGTATIERYIPDKKCNQAKTKIEKLGCKVKFDQLNEKKKAVCTKVLKRDAACKNFIDIAEQLRQGCDNSS
ncbi:unnamed protein product [Clavelina lepadiformis]|uniref:NTR domain-containing protein n=1 Tax=Clavelina lepadiformis TaxID=159417 RepID=A0ABP0H495_CLALP